jgi:hypothetical protein
MIESAMAVNWIGCGSWFYDLMLQDCAKVHSSSHPEVSDRPPKLLWTIWLKRQQAASL